MKTFILAAAGISACAFGGERVDFVTGEGTNGWAISSGEYASPLYSNAVDKVDMEYTGEGSGTLYATANGGGESLVASMSSVSSLATFVFPETVDVRSFRVAAEGEWRLLSFEAEVSSASLPAPEGVVVTNNITGTSFDAAWGAVAEAQGYRVWVWTNVVVGASAGMALWSEDFPSSPSTGSSTKAFEDGFADNAGWTCENVFATASAGVVRLGSSTAWGWLESPALGEFSQSPLTLRFTAWRYSKDSGVAMPVRIVSSDGVTNDLAVVSLATNSVAYHIALPQLSAGDRILLSSTTNKVDGRVALDDVAIVYGHSEGHEEPSYIVEGLDVGNVTSNSLSNLPSVPVHFAVTAYGRRGAVSAKSASVEVDLANPQQVARLAACDIATFDEDVYEENFDSLAQLTSTPGAKEWLNGVTLSEWQAWRGGSAANSINYNGGKATIGSLYAPAAAQKDEGRAFGGLSTQDSRLTWGIAFTNSAEVSMTLSAVSYSLQQWGFNNTQPQQLVMSCLVTNRLDWIPSLDSGWISCVESTLSVYADDSHDTPVATSVSFTPETPIKVAPGEVLYLKWDLPMPAAGSSAMAAIDDLRVTFTRGAEPLVLRLVRR